MVIRAYIYKFPTCVGRIGVAAWLGLLLAGCAGMGPPQPEADYRANVTVEMSGASDKEPAVVHLVERSAAPKRRREVKADDDAAILIDRGDLGVTWKLNPKTKSFEEHRISSDASALNFVPDPFGPHTRARFELVGAEVLDGVSAEKFAVKGETISGFAWLTSDRIPIRFSGTIDSNGSPVELDVAYTDIERVSQEAHQFGIPPTYAGFDRRTQARAKVRHNQSSADTENMVKGLEAEQRGTQSTPPPPGTF